MRGRLLWVVAVWGCAQQVGPQDPDPVQDTAVEECTHLIIETRPYDGFGSWYWRDLPTGLVTEPDPDAYSIALYEEGDGLLTDEAVWREDELGFSFALDEPLKPNRDYLLTVQDCESLHEIAFRTSSFGEPLVDGPEALIGRTWHLDLQGAHWIEPGVVSGLMQIYFNMPILLGVVDGDEGQITFMGAPGKVGPLTGMVQDKSMATWPFPPSSFDEAPYFSTEGATIMLDIQGADVPIEQFSFNGTLSADGATIGGGVIQGLVDSRHLGRLLQQPGEPAALCNLAAGVGVDCIPCGDGAPYCLYMHAREARATWVQGLELQEVL